MTWADATYNYKKPITIDHTKVVADATDFTVLVSVTDVLLKDTAHGGHVNSTSGFDIVFYDSTEVTLRYHEKESYDGVNGTINYWVKTSISATSDTVLYMYYGKSVPADPSSTSAWDANHVGVWHMDDLTTSTIADSSTGAYTGTKTATNQPVEVTGQIYKGQDFDGTDDHIDFTASIIPLGNKTVSFWISTDNTTGTYVPICTGDVNSDQLSGFAIFQDTTSFYFRMGNGATTGYFMKIDLLAIPGGGAFHHVYCSYDGTTFRAAIDAGTESTSTTKSGTEAAASSNLIVGRCVDAHPFPWNGKIDEVRIASSYRTAAWMHTAYHNEYSPSTFLAVGAESCYFQWTKTVAEIIGLLDVVSIVAHHTIIVPDSIAIQDVVSASTVRFTTVVEAAGIKETVASSHKTSKTIPELIGLKDIVVPVWGTAFHNWTKTVSELIGVKDTYATVSAHKPTISELIGIDDTVTDIYRPVRTFAEIIGLKDTTTTGAYRPRTIAEMMGVLDTVLVAGGHPKTVTELIGLADIAVEQKATAKTITETIGLFEFNFYPKPFPLSFSIAFGYQTGFITKRYRTYPEIINILDTTSNLARHTKTDSELIGLLDTVSATSSIIKTIPETIAIADVVTKLSLHYKTIPELVGVLDATATLAKRYRTITETIGILDALYFRKPIRLSEYIGMLDVGSAMLTASKTILVAERLGIFEFNLYPKSFPLPFSIAFGYQTGFMAKRYRTYAELVGIKDTSTPTARHTTIGSESIGLLDGFQYVEKMYRTIAETMGLLDVNTNIEGAPILKTVAELIGLTDVVSKTSAHTKTTAELLGLLDVVSKAASRQRTIAETIGVLDSVQSAHSAYKTINEIIGLTDISDELWATGLQKTINESIGLLDVVTKTSLHAKTAIEIMGLRDAYGTTAFHDKTIAELIGMFDDVSAFKPSAGNYTQTVVEAIGMSDSIATISVRFMTIAELLALADGVETISGFHRTVAESIGLLDSVSKSAAFRKTITESIGVLDSLWFGHAMIDAELIGLLDAAHGIMNYVSQNIGYLYEIDVYY